MSGMDATSRASFSAGWPAHAYDPDVHPEYFQGVLGRRAVAFAIDLAVITLPMILAAFLVLVFGAVTLGLGWMLFLLFPVASLIWAAIYYGLCFAGPASATLGMRAVGLEMHIWYGAPSYFLLGAAHAVVFWISFLTPFVLIIGLLNRRRRLLHDILVGTIVVNTEARAQALRRRNSY
jgi:uncharacterized RDD family membrane protein YckC